MADKTKIEWTEATWNPIRARNKATGGVGHFCVHVSDGCKNCYAEHMQRRFRNKVRYAAQDRDKVELFLDEKVLTQPLRWRRPRMIFPCSMTDLFYEGHPDEWLDRIFAVMALASQHTFQPLTKRSRRQREYFAGHQLRERISAMQWAEIEDRVDPLDRRRDDLRALAMDVDGDDWPLPNVWLGVSVEDQQRADERRDDLKALADSGWTTWVSYEPALGPVDWSGWDFIKWLVAGGESAQNKPGRPAHPDWFRSLRDQCQAAGVPFHFKQHGDFLHESQRDANSRMLHNAWQGGGTDGEDGWHTWPDGSASLRIGKKAAGRLLDGREWDEVPERVS